VAAGSVAGVTQHSADGAGPDGAGPDGDPVGAAVAAWRRRARELGCPAVTTVVRLPLDQAIGRVTARPVLALRASPGYDAAAMDGVAVTVARLAGAVRDGAVDGGRAVLPAADVDVVDTGDPLPEGRDAVVMREQVTRRPGGGQALGEEVLLPVDVRPYQHVRPVGEDLVPGELLLPAGHRLDAVDVAAAAAAGLTDLAVHRAPLVAVLPTGDEIRPVGAVTGPGEILDTNSLMIAGQLRALGCEARVLPIAPDDPARIAAAVRAAAGGTGESDRGADLVVLIAGASAGRDDHTAAVVGSLGEVVVHGVAVRPGHPVLLGVVGRTPVLGCPGYPVSAALTVDLFAAPLLAALEGTGPVPRPQVRAVLGTDLGSVARAEDWVRVRLTAAVAGPGRDATDDAGGPGDLVVSPLARGAGALTSLVRADGLLRVPVGTAGLPAGRTVSVGLLRAGEPLERRPVLAGPPDEVVDLLVRRLAERDPRTVLAHSPGTAMAALAALRQGLCHLAGWTLRTDPPRDDDPAPVAIRLADRRVGLVTAPRNPLGLAGTADLARAGLRFVNRPPGTGSRDLLDAALARIGLDPAHLHGYTREARSGAAVVQAVASGRADCGLATEADARTGGLGFLPLAELPYDLLLPAAATAEPAGPAGFPGLEALLDLVTGAGFAADVAAVPGCSATRTGQRVRQS
jgi:putative molybdopterin biosynthesis protein